MSRGALALAAGAAIGAALLAIREVVPRRATERPLGLRVVDADTGRPLPGIRVHRMVETERYSFPNLEPSGHRFVLSTFETDADGSARMARIELSLSRHEYLTYENVYVNLDVDPAWRWYREPDVTPEQRLRIAVQDAFVEREEQSVVTPAAAYRGAVIHSVERDVDPGWVKAAARPRYDVLWNGSGLTRPEETIVVRLRRHRETGAAAPVP